MKNFDEWNELKKQIQHKTNEEVHIQTRDVWMTSIGINLGFEQDGSGENFSRPVVIIKKFNHSIAWIIPLSSKQKDIDYYYNYTDPQGRKVAAIIPQLKLLSIERFERKMYKISAKHFDDIVNKVISYLLMYRKTKE